MKLVNISNNGRIITKFIRENDNLIIQEDKTFFPYYYEPITGGEFIGYDGTELKKFYVSNPKAIRDNSSTKSFESDVNYCKMYMLDKIKEIEKTNLKISFIDIEVLSDIFISPEKDTAPISCISCSNSYTNEIKSFYLGDYKSEFDMIEDFISYQQKEKFDLWIGWNLYNYDAPYLINRIPDFSKRVSPIGETQYGHNGLFYPAGIGFLDLMLIDKKFTNNRKTAYSLEARLNDVLGRGKEIKDVKWGKLSIEHKNRCKNDVRDMVEFEKKTQYIPILDGLRRLTKTLWTDFIFNSRYIDQLLLQEARKKKIVLPSKSSDVNDDEFEGAFRKVFTKGALYGCSSYDLSGAYLNTIISLCIDPINLKTEQEENTIPINLTDRETNETKQTYYMKQNSDALLPTVANTLLNEKNKLKKLLKETDPSSEEFKDREEKYKAYKNLSLSAWGVIGEKHFRYFDNTVASLITATVRDVLHYVIDKLKELGYIVHYTDSVAKDTPVIIKSKKGIEIIPIEDLYPFQSEKKQNKQRYYIFDKNVSIWTDFGWSKIKYVYRHKCQKKMYRILTRTGYVEVSSDHSLVINNKSKKPSDLKVGDFIESIPFKLKNNLTIDSQLAWLVGFWLAEGSCGVYKNIGKEKSTKISWHLDNQNIKLLNKAKHILDRYGIKTKIIDCRKSSATFRLLPDGNYKLLCELFSHWCLTKRKDKKIPSFILNSTTSNKKAFLDGYLKGDGSINKTDGVISCCSIDKSLLKAVASILDSLGIEYTLDIRKDKPNVINLRMLNDKNDKRKLPANQIRKIEMFDIDDDIYDIETKNHHFCGGFGNINLHNTDGCIIDDKKRDLTELLNSLVQQWSMERFGKAVSIEFEWEGRYESLFILALCRYYGYLHSDAGIEKKTIGLEQKRKDSTIFLKSFQENFLNKILKEKINESQAIDYINEKIQELKQSKLEDIAFPCQLSQNEYTKTTPIFLRALNYTKDLNPRFNKKPGERYFYIYVNSIGKEKEKTIQKVIMTYDKNGEETDYKPLTKIRLQKAINKHIVDETPEDIAINVLKQKGLIKDVKVTKETKDKDVLAFDTEIKDHITSEMVDWDKMIERNIHNKAQVIFDAMGWDYNKLNKEV